MIFDNSLVSVIIPCRNAESYISESIDSALHQSYSNIEVIIVDDGSTDASIEIIKCFGNLVRLETIDHQGACAARNLGLQVSKGEYIQFLDADDVLLLNKIEVQLPYLTSNQCDLVFCNGYLFGDDRPQRPIKKLRALPPPHGTDPFIYSLKNGFGTEGPLHRRHILEKVGGFRVGLIGAQEYDLHIRLGAAGVRLHKVDDYLFCHRNHNDPNRITRTPKPPGFNAQMLMGLLSQLQEDMPNSLTPERRKALAGKLFQSSIYAYRGGAEDIAAEGFKQAIALSPDLEYNERFFYKLMVNVVDPMFAEGCLKQARLLRNVFKGALTSALSGATYSSYL
jgi:glycosyltransferase involved in cell wall biosynthesis